MIWNILVFLGIGALIGWLVSLIMKVKGGWLFTILLGVAGSFLGSFVCSILPFIKSEFMALSVPSIIGGVIGGCLLVWVIRLIKK